MSNAIAKRLISGQGYFRFCNLKGNLREIGENLFIEFFVVMRVDFEKKIT